MKLLRYWIGECTTKHLYCGSGKTAFVPFRLIYIKSAEPNPILRIHQTSPDDRGLHYLALSHCWGDPQRITKLTMKDLAQYGNDLPFTSLPRTFQDAVHVTLGLGLRYLWIDSLCIIQDSGEDWARESASMAAVYENALCTIAAAGATDAHGGCFATRDPLRMAKCRLSDSGRDGSCIIASGRGSASPAAVISRSPLASRAWVLQERLLSKRMIHFGAQAVYWTCIQGLASETLILGSGDITPGHSRPIFGDEAGILDWKAVSLPIQGHTFFNSLVASRLEPSNIRSMIKFHSDWFHLISIYTRCRLTVVSDKLVAMSGIVQRIQESTGFRYLAGLWRDMLPFNLCWFVDRDAQPPPEDYRAPSWSWASRDGEIYFWSALTENTIVLADIISAEATTDANDPSGTGAVSAACLEVAGSLKEVCRPSFHRLPGSTSAKTIQWLFDEETKLGQFSFDSPTSVKQAGRIHLLPLLLSLPPNYRACRDTEPEWKEICGLVLSPSNESSKESARFQRIGFFHFYCLKPNFDPVKWFVEASELSVTMI